MGVFQLDRLVCKSYLTSAYIYFCSLNKAILVETRKYFSNNYLQASRRPLLQPPKSDVRLLASFGLVLEAVWMQGTGFAF
jgi:hypothetical protein